MIGDSLQSDYLGFAKMTLASVQTVVAVVILTRSRVCTACVPILYGRASVLVAVIDFNKEFGIAKACLNSEDHSHVHLAISHEQIDQRVGSTPCPVSYGMLSEVGASVRRRVH